MIRAGSDKRRSKPNEAGTAAKSAENLLTKTEQKVRMLQAKIGDQQRQIRELQSRAKHEESSAAEAAKFRSEIHHLKDEVKELTRANREHVSKNEALRSENEALRANARARGLGGMIPGSILRDRIQDEPPVKVLKPVSKNEVPNLAPLVLRRRKSGTPVG